MNKNHIWLLLLWLFMVGGQLQGATPDSTWRAQALQFYHEMQTGLPRLVWDWQVNPYWLGAGLGDLLIKSYDSPWQNQMARKRYLPSFLAATGRNYGSWAAPAWLAWMAFQPLPGSKPRLRKPAERRRYILEAYGTTAALTVFLKIVTHRRRPDGSNYFSFPSGHTSTAFVTAQITENLYGPRWGLPAYALAVITALSRIQENKHYPTDVLFAAGLGISVAQAFWRHHER